MNNLYNLVIELGKMKEGFHISCKATGLTKTLSGLNYAHDSKNSTFPRNKHNPIFQHDV